MTSARRAFGTVFACLARVADSVVDLLGIGSTDVGAAPAMLDERTDRDSHRSMWGRMMRPVASFGVDGMDDLERPECAANHHATAELCECLRPCPRTAAAYGVDWSAFTPREPSIWPRKHVSILPLREPDCRFG